MAGLGAQSTATNQKLTQNVNAVAATNSQASPILPMPSGPTSTTANQQLSSRNTTATPNNSTILSNILFGNTEKAQKLGG